MPRGPLRTGENASISMARTTGGRCWPLTGAHAGVAQQRTAHLGRQPGSVSDVKMVTPMLLICKTFFLSISTVETPPSRCNHKRTVAGDNPPPPLGEEDRP